MQSMSTWSADLSLTVFGVPAEETKKKNTENNSEFGFSVQLWPLNEYAQANSQQLITFETFIQAAGHLK